MENQNNIAPINPESQPIKKPRTKFLGVVVILIGIVILVGAGWLANELFKQESVNELENDNAGSEIGCEELWWKDNEHPDCQGPKKFCGTYMYYGLQTFKTKELCEQSNKIKYINDEYGFSIEFPKTWKDYKATPRTLNWGINGTCPSFDFGFAEQLSLFNISVHTAEQWNKINSDEGPKPSYIATNNSYVFAFAKAHDVSNDEMLERAKEIDSIISTFRINNQRNI